MNPPFRSTMAWLRLPAGPAFVLAAPMVVMGDIAPVDGDKSGYSLFHPTPPALMREMSADRPDKTESPYTVDAGHFQMEIDLVNYSYDRDTDGGRNTRTDDLFVAPMNLKLGLLNNVDLQVILGTYNRVREEDRTLGTTQTTSGFAGVATRLKINLWGNDGGRTAMGVMPFVIFPSGQEGLGIPEIEGGVIFPLAVELPHGWSLGMMTEFAMLNNETGNGRDATFINSITFGHGIWGKLSGYVEFFSQVSAGNNSGWIGTADFGLTYRVTANFLLDAGVNFGVTDRADNLNVFTGFTWRF